MAISSEVALPPIVCTLAERRSGLQVEIAAQIRSDAARSGTYRLQVIKQGPAGNSQINQQSEFALDAGRSIQVQGLRLSMEPSARYRAVLSISSGGATYACERIGPEGGDDL